MTHTEAIHRVLWYHNHSRLWWSCCLKSQRENAYLLITNFHCGHVLQWASYQIRKLRVAHAPGIPGTFSPLPTSRGTASWRSRHASRHVRHARAVMHVGIANPRWRGKRFRYAGRKRKPKFYLWHRICFWTSIVIPPSVCLTDMNHSKATNWEHP